MAAPYHLEETFVVLDANRYVVADLQSLAPQVAAEAVRATIEFAVRHRATGRCHHDRDGIGGTLRDESGMGECRVGHETTVADVVVR
jgi:hypothetical protein